MAYTRQEFGCEEETNHFSGIHPCFHKINPLLIIHTFHRRSLPNQMQWKRIKVFLLQSVSLLANSRLHHLKTTFFNCWITYVGFKLCLFRSKNMYNERLDKLACLLLLAASPWAAAVQQAVAAASNILSVTLCWRLPTSPAMMPADSNLGWQYFMSHE